MGQQPAGTEVLGVLDDLDVEAIDVLLSALAEERASRLRYQRFAEMLAHDVKGPLASVHGHLALARDPDVPEDVRARSVDRAASTLLRATRLVDRLYELAETATGDVPREHVDLDEVVQDVLEDLSAELARSGAVVEVAGPLGGAVADRALVGQALANLVCNAVRHARCDDGPVHVTVGVVRRAEGVVLRVTDDGDGMPEDLAATAFDAGPRGAGSTGLGLGLATVRAVAERHGGRAWADSGPGGTCVSVLLPGSDAGGMWDLVTHGIVDGPHASG